MRHPVEQENLVHNSGRTSPSTYRVFFPCLWMFTSNVRLALVTPPVSQPIQSAEQVLLGRPHKLAPRPFGYLTWEAPYESNRNA